MLSEAAKRSAGAVEADGQPNTVSRYFLATGRPGSSSRCDKSSGGTGRPSKYFDRKPASAPPPKRLAVEMPPATPLEGSDVPEVPRTPLERQVDALRASAPDCLLLVEVGYKFIAFAEDAHTAAAALGLSAFRSRSVTTAVFPTTRLEVHAHRLLCAGHRVAIALQSETAAERRDGADPRAATFARHLVGAWTLATWTCAPDASGSVSASRAAAGDHNAAPAELTEDGAWASPRVAPRVLLVVHESGGGGGGGGGG